MTAVRSIQKITLTNEKNVYLACNYESDKLYVSLIDIEACEGYCGYAMKSDLLLQAAKIPMVIGDFISLTKKALIRHDADESQFIYCLEKDCENLFKWKSIDNDETVINIGCIKVYKKNYGSLISDVFIMLSEELLSLNKKVVNIESDRQESEKEKLEALHLLSVATSVKESLENELYSKFILVLNEKKKRIRELEQNTYISQPKKIRSAKRKSSEKPMIIRHQVSDSSDEIDSHLESINEPGPSINKSDSSLLFLDDDDEQKLPVTHSKIRKRNVNNTKICDFVEALNAATNSKHSASESEDELLKDL